MDLIRLLERIRRRATWRLVIEAIEARSDTRWAVDEPKSGRGRDTCRRILRRL